jgi:hypothetical protein
VGAEVVQAAESTARAKSRVTSLEQRTECLLHELRRVVDRPPLNAPLLDTMRRWHRDEKSALRAWQTREDRARHQEQQLRETLAGLRNQERSLERALEAERHRWQQRIQAQEMFRADELWLQHSLRESS